MKYQTTYDFFGNVLFSKTSTRSDHNIGELFVRRNNEVYEVYQIITDDISKTMVLRVKLSNQKPALRNMLKKRC